VGAIACDVMCVHRRRQLARAFVRSVHECSVRSDLLALLSDELVTVSARVRVSVFDACASQEMYEQLDAVRARPLTDTERDVTRSTTSRGNARLVVR
jgi:hypothetical protein